MNVTSLIRKAESAGLSLSLSPTESVVVKGPKLVLQAWRTRLKDHKDSIRAKLLKTREFNDGPHRWWRIHQIDQPPTALCCHPEKTLQEIRCLYPNASRIEQCEPQAINPSRTLSNDEEMAIRLWLEQIEETDQDTIDHLLQQANIDQEAREFYLGQTATLNIQH